MEWLKWIIDASKIANKTSPSIGLLCMDNKGRIVASLDKKIGDVPVLDAQQQSRYAMLLGKLGIVIWIKSSLKAIRRL